MARKDREDARLRWLLTDFALGFALGIVFVAGAAAKRGRWPTGGVLPMALVTGVISAVFGRRFWRFIASRPKSDVFGYEKSKGKRQRPKKAPGGKKRMS